MEYLVVFVVGFVLGVIVGRKTRTSPEAQSLLEAEVRRMIRDEMDGVS